MFSTLANSAKKVFKALFIDSYTPPNSSESSSAVSLGNGDTPKYPPIDHGIQLASIKSLLDSQKDLIVRIQNTAGLSQHEFEERFLPVLNNLARYVHLLPATRTSHHRGAGGLFRMALEMGLYCLQIGNSTIFHSRGAVSAEAHYKLRPRWAYATFIAGTCSELYRPITNMVVTDENGNKWPQLLSPLYDWILAQNSTRYHVVWNAQDEASVIALHQATAAYILNAIAPKGGLQYLNEENTEIVTAMTSCITNAVPLGVNNQIHSIVTTVRKKIIERDLMRNSERYGDFSVGSHLEPYLVDAMRKLIRKKTWEVNAKGARIWHSDEGMFIVWQPAAREMIALLKDEMLPGIPNEADTLADILITSGIAESNDDDGRYWDICIPVSMQVLPSLKLQRIEVLFNEASELKTLDGVLLPRNMAIRQPAVQPELVASKKLAAPLKAAVPIVSERGGEELPRAQEKPAEETSVVIPQPVEAAPQQIELIESVPGMAAASANSVGREKKAARPAEKINAVLLAETTERIFKSVPPDVADYLKAIVEDHQDGSSAGPVFSTPDGIAISVLELESHGQANFAGLVKALYDKHWLWAAEEKPLSKLFDLPHEGKSIRSIVIRRDIAIGMGFNWKQPKKGAKGD